MNTKKELRVALEELEALLEDVCGPYEPLQASCDRGGAKQSDIESKIRQRIRNLREQIEEAPEDSTDHILESHRTLCRAKNMHLKSAYGHDPFLYYACGVAGEAGEICNKIVKGYREGFNIENAKQAIRSELPDVFIYGTILGFIADINIQDEINKKVGVVVERALNGYYGAPFEFPIPPFQYLLGLATNVTK